MSVITLQYGQCGTQIGGALFSTIYNDVHNAQKKDQYWSQAALKWFHVTEREKWEPRSILIDTDNKTVNHKASVPYKFKTVTTRSCGGSANNWAFGYCYRSKLLIDDIYEYVRKEIEKCDLLSSFLNICSSSGGTGSGVGSYVIECLRNEYPNKTIINSVIIPYMNGEIVTQSYNSLLTLSKIYSISDSTILFENDRLDYICKNYLNIKDVTFNDVNRIIAQKLALIYYPVRGVQTGHLLGSLCAHPSFKLLQIRCAPMSKDEDSHNWKYLLNSVTRQTRFDFQQQSSSSLRLRTKNVSTALISRGTYVPKDSDLKTFKESNPNVSWLPESETFQAYHQSQKFLSNENCLGVISNSNSVCVPLNSIMEDALNLFQFGAYVHHYKKFGIDEAYFEECFGNLKKILHDYKKI